jgi:hypothetical protein
MAGPGRQSLVPTMGFEEQAAGRGVIDLNGSKELDFTLEQF